MPLWSEMQSEIVEKYCYMSILEKLSGAYLCCVEPLEMMKKFRNVLKSNGGWKRQPQKLMWTLQIKVQKK